MKIRTTALLFTCAFLLQSTVFGVFDFLGGTPNLVLCFLISYTFLFEKEEGIFIAILFGLLGDLCFGRVVGIASISFLFVGILIVFTRKYLNKDNVISSLLTAAGGTITYNLGYYLISNAFAEDVEFLRFLSHQPVYIVENILVCIALYYLFINKVVKHRNDRYYR